MDIRKWMGLKEKALIPSVMNATEFMNGLETTYATEPMDIPNVKQCQKNHGVSITTFVGKLDTSSPMEVEESTEPVPMSTENN